MQSSRRSVHKDVTSFREENVGLNEAVTSLKLENQDLRQSLTLTEYETQVTGKFLAHLSKT